MAATEPLHDGAQQADEGEDSLRTLKYRLLGPSLTKAGQDKVDQGKVRSLAVLFCTRKRWPAQPGHV